MNRPNVPPEQLSRQAIESLKGYAYQLYLSVDEWMKLGPEDALFLEVAEDYAKLANSVLTMTQAKTDAGSGSVTLRSVGAVKAITSLWEFQNANPKLDVRLIYLTTSNIGREKGIQLPDRAPGIAYWRQAAQGAELGPLRALLLGLALPGEILAFLQDAEDETLRARLLRPLHWTCGAAAFEEVRQRLLDRLVNRAADRKLLATDGEDTLSALLERVLLAIVTGDRKLTRVDFERVFEGAATVPVSITLMRDMMRTAGAAPPVRMAPAPADILVARPQVAKAAIESLLRDSRVALIGIGGSGKTELAAALADTARVRESFPDGVFWASIGREAGLAAHLEAWIAAAGLTPPRTDDESALAAAWRGALYGRRVLVVADDVWRPEQLMQLRPPKGCGFVVTGRSPVLASALAVEPVEVGALEVAEALELIGCVSGLDLEGQLRADAGAFCEQVGRLALPLVLAGALVRDGRDFLTLATELRDEELRLSALDLDPGSDTCANDDARRSISLEACLGLSIRALDERHRTAFYRLAVLPEAAVFDGETISSILAAPDPVSASRLLDVLASRGVLTRVKESAYRLYRIHDLLLDYARTAFGPGRPRVAPVPDRLPARLSGLHRELLDRLIDASPTGRWADIDDALHYDQFLGWHMAMAGRAELLQVLMTEKDATGAPAWLARARRDGETSAFLGDLSRTLSAASAEIQGAQTDALLAQGVGSAAACCTAFAIIAQQASATPVGLLPSLVRSYQMTADEALTSATLASGALGCWLLAELLSLVPAASRRQTWLRLLAKSLEGDEFAMIGDDEFLQILLPALEPLEWQELLTRLAELPAIVQAKVLAQIQPWRTAAADAELARFLAERPDGPALAGWSAGVIHLAACGVPTGHDAAQLTGLLKHCGRFHREAKSIFLLIKDFELAAAFRDADANRLTLMIDPFERFDRPLPLVALLDAVGVAEREPDRAARALLMARLCERVGDQRLEALCATALTLLLALDDSDWRKVDGLGRIIPQVVGQAKRDAEMAFARAGATVGFGSLGAMRLRAIAAGLGIEVMIAILDELPEGKAFDRQVTLPALLEHADDSLVWRITEAIIAEAGESGGIGDVHRAAHRVPNELLLVLRDARRQLPIPEFVEAVRALAGPANALPSPLTTWVQDGWAYLGPDCRLITAVQHSCYTTSETAVADVAACLLGAGEPLSDASAALRAAPQVLARFSHAEVCEAIVRRIGPKLAHLPSYRIGDAARLSRYMTDAQVRTLIIGASSDDDLTRAAYALAALAPAIPAQEAMLIGRAVELLARRGDPHAAANWIVTEGGQLDAAAAAPLLALRCQTTEPRGLYALSTALYRFLSPAEQSELANWLAHLRPLTPSFVATLDIQSYPKNMRAALDICRFSGGPAGLEVYKGALDSASRFLQTDIHVMQAVLRQKPPREVALIAVNLLRSGITLGLRDFSQVMSRVAASLEKTLGQTECHLVAQNVADIAVLYANSGNNARAL